MTLLYVDASAMVKRLVDEPESSAFEELITEELARGSELVASALLEVELHRFAVRTGIASEHVNTVLRNVSLVAVTSSVIELAVGISEPVTSVDAIHLGTALMLASSDEDEEGVTQVLTYDRVMTRVADRLGFAVPTS